WTLQNSMNFCDWVYTTDGPQGQYTSHLPAINSTTQSNGFMRLDGDSCNVGGTGNILDASLVSPAMDLTNYPSVILNFQHAFTYCCTQSVMLNVEVSNDGGSSWTQFDVRQGIGV